MASCLGTIRKEQQFWGTTADSERTGVIRAIKDLEYIADVDFIKAWRDQIFEEDVFLLRDMLPIITQDSNISCVDFARILGRRQELRYPAHDIWVSLLLTMMEQRMDMLLSWSCVSLPANVWFRWLSDLQIIFPPETDQLSWSRLGMTVQRRRWWAKLSDDYMDAIQHLESLQRGQQTLKWLYLEVIPDCLAVLDAIKQRESLPRYKLV